MRLTSDMIVLLKKNGLNWEIRTSFDDRMKDLEEYKD